MRRNGFVLPTGIFLLVLVSMVLYFHLAGYQAEMRAFRHTRTYWQIQTITNRVNEIHLAKPAQIDFQFAEGSASLKGSQISIRLSSGETAIRHVWQRNQILK
ncbi:hypothetical protein [Furfurilactobacillus siliginis]|uniref:Uncharacterized protein n=1 Tax=Furfurilactobacillus siliginis TaxID=348151 RepID=A0A0R2KVH9_9LACO|nr:hypothetical protein [Furfurilactobacillus siliginis]KRN93583.1 hypothetical protein IV55_GL001002 [Furfurilactobacillus siliginis]GEK29239.1 hypothetical protein LSI01_15500 [Furfurilactobacillus siliginis]